MRHNSHATKTLKITQSSHELSLSCQQSQYSASALVFLTYREELTSKTHLFLRGGIITVTVKKVIQEADTCFKENPNSNGDSFQHVDSS